MSLGVKWVEVLGSTADVIKREGNVLVTEIVDELLVAASEEELGKYLSSIVIYFLDSVLNLFVEFQSHIITFYI